MEFGEFAGVQTKINPPNGIRGYTNEVRLRGLGEVGRGCRALRYFEETIAFFSRVSKLSTHAVS